ncbi:hypothetical protein Tco_0986230 [Tanacetum coccineum]
MRELREDTFSGNKNDDAYEHVERVLDIINLFNIPGVSHDTVMLRVFPITLTGAAKRWLEEIHNFKQEGDETLCQAWEWYNDLLYKCPTHDIITIRSRNIESSSDSEGIAAIVNKLENLDRDMKKLKENVHAIQVGCQTCEGAYLDKDCPLNKENKGMKEVKYGEFSRPFPNNRYDDRFNKGGYDQPLSGEKRPSLTKIINKYMEEASKRQAEQDEWLKKFYQRRANNKKFEDCKTIYSKNRLPLYTPLYYSPEEIEYFSANSAFSDNEEQEIDDSGMAEAVAALEATLKKKRE